MPRTVAGERTDKRPPLSLRTTQDLRKQLETAALASGRSLAQEVEYRLERSLDRRATVMEAFGSNNPELMRALNLVLAGLWREDGKVPRHLVGLNPALLLAAITTILAAAEKNVDQLAAKAHPMDWMTFARLGIARACGLSPAEAEERAKKVLPKAAQMLASYERGREIAESALGKSARKGTRK